MTKLLLMMKKLVIILSLVFSSIVYAVDREATGLSYADITSKYAECVSGVDRLILPPGTATWNRAILFNRDVDIIGSGVGSTIIIDEINSFNGTTGIGNWNTGGIILAPPAGSTVRLSGIEVRASNTYIQALDGYSSGFVQMEASAFFVIDNCLFDNLYRRSLHYWGASKGLVTDVRFNQRHGEQSLCFYQGEHYGRKYGDGAYSNPPEYGTTDTWVYVEDCDVYGTSVSTGGQNMTDGFSGAKFVIRFCTIREIGVGVHGTESTNRHRGARALEVYHNLFQDLVGGGSGDYATIELRSGAGKFFNNVSSGNWQYDFVLTNYRNASAYHPWCGADGTLLWDTNITTDDGTGDDNTPANDGIFCQGVTTNINTLDWNDTTGLTISQSGATVTASGGTPFTSAMIGRYIHIAPTSGFISNRQITGFTNSTTVTVTPSGTVNARPFMVGRNCTVDDSTKNWTPNEWQGYTCRERTGNFTVTSSTTRNITVSGAGWNQGQWFYWTLVRNSNGDRAVVHSNSSTTLTLAQDGAALTIPAGETFYLTRASEIVSNTDNQLILMDQSSVMSSYCFPDGRTYEIRKVDYALDQPGRGLSLPISPVDTVNIQPQNLSQQADPVYEWNNLKNGTAWTHNIAHRTIHENREYYRYNTSFTGATGVGRGLRATMNAITNPTPGVAFWVTDEGIWNTTFSGTIGATSIVDGYVCEIVTTGSSDFTSIGARTNAVGEVFKATGVGTGTGTVKPAQGRLYVANSSNEWVLDYTPLTYPHPLSPVAVPDTTDPELSSATINTAGTQLTLVFSESVTGINSANFSLSGGLSLSSASGSGPTWNMTISPAATVAASYTIGYTAGTTEDLAGNPLGNFSGTSVTNNTEASDVTVPVLESATIDSMGTTLTLVYSEPVTGVVLGDYGMSFRTLSNLAGSGNTRTFTITPAAEYQVAYTIAYEGGTEDLAGNPLATISGYYTVNNTAAPSGPNTRNSGRTRGKKNLIR